MAYSFETLGHFEVISSTNDSLVAAAVVAEEEPVSVPPEIESALASVMPTTVVVAAAATGTILFLWVIADRQRWQQSSNMEQLWQRSLFACVLREGGKRGVETFIKYKKQEANL